METEERVPLFYGNASPQSTEVREARLVLALEAQDGTSKTHDTQPIGRKCLLISGPKVFADNYEILGTQCYYAVVSRSLKKRPPGCDILSSE